MPNTYFTCTKLFKNFIKILFIREKYAYFYDKVFSLNNNFFFSPVNKKKFLFHSICTIPTVTK